MLSDAVFYDLISILYQFIKSFLDKKMSVFEEYEASKISPLFKQESKQESTKIISFVQNGDKSANRIQSLNHLI